MSTAKKSLILDYFVDSESVRKNGSFLPGGGHKKGTCTGIPDRCLPSFMEKVYVFIFQNVGYQSV